MTSHHFTEGNDVRPSLAYPVPSRGSAPVLKMSTRRSVGVACT